jgi:formylglycine-generating enzyme required for sulfatase activity
MESARIVGMATGWEVQRHRLQLNGALQDLGGGVTLSLLRIPAGAFEMGSPEHELGRSDDEGPRHPVRLREFWMGRTPITQAQWRAVAGQVPPLGQRWQRELKLNPSRFSDQPDSDQRPVERVSWDDAIEFCRRLSALSGNVYSLPSEAQWEYACRAGTTTEFHCGATLSTKLVNYDGRQVYGQGEKEVYRKQTTDVFSFPANPWGLYDMHGNVWEWCADQWHHNYAGAPEDGRAWIDDEVNKKKNDMNIRLLRGGSWVSIPGYCRSAYRVDGHPAGRNYGIGFRVCCLPQD